MAEVTRERYTKNFGHLFLLCKLSWAMAFDRATYGE